MPFTPYHIPALFLATSFTFGGLLPYFNAPYAVRELGLPPHVASSPPAQSVFRVYGTRMTTYGMALYAFMAQVNVLSRVAGVDNADSKGNELIVDT